MVKKIENYSKPKLPNRNEFLNAKNIVTIISAGLLTITLGCSGNAKLVETTETIKNIEAQAQTLNDSTKIIYPNPFMPTFTSIAFNVKESRSPRHVIIRMYNVKGELVRNLVDKNFETGDHKISWDGNDNEGISVEAGIYFYRCTFNGIEYAPKKLILMK